MSLALTLVQTSPATNPDRNIVKVGFSGTYPLGGDRLPLEDILDPDILVQVPLNDPAQNPPPVTPYVLNAWLNGYNAAVERVVIGSGLQELTEFYLRLFGPGAPGPSPVAAELGAAGNYALLASAGITNTGNTIIGGGNIGSSPTATITGFPPGVLTSPAAIDTADAAAAQTALTSAINYYKGLTPTLSGLANLSTGGNGTTAATYTPGNYFGAAGLTMPTGIILDALGNPNAVFVFVAGSTINLASGQTISLINGAQAANVVFVAGSAFTSVATSTVNGNILAVSGITLGGGALNGRALVTTGPVTIAAATAVTVPVPAGTSAAGEFVGGAPYSSAVGNAILNGEVFIEILCPTVQQ